MKDMKYFTEEDKREENKHRKIDSLSLTNREMTIKAIMRYHNMSLEC